MGISAKSDFQSEIEFWTKEATDQVVKDALSQADLKETFTEKQVKIIAWMSAYIATKLLIAYNDMDLDYQGIPNIQETAHDSGDS